jgi:hypothetical protein
MSQQIWAAKRGSPSQSDIASMTLDLMIRKVTERQASVRNSIPLGKDPWMGAGLPYIQMEGMIDGSEAIDWVSRCYIVEIWNTTTNIVQSLLDQLFQNQVKEAMQ